MTGDLAFKVTNSTKEEMGMTIEGFFFFFLGIVCSDRSSISELICDLNVYSDCHTVSLAGR